MHAARIDTPHLAAPARQPVLVAPEPDEDEPVPQARERRGATRGTGRIVIVANRLPVRRVTRGKEQSWEPSAGGLVTAMKPVLEREGGEWVGWTGVAGPAPRAFTHEGVRIRPVSMSAAEVAGFYEGFSNRTLWPLYHDAIRAPEFHREWWRPYVALNERFARAAASAAPPGGIVWIHDYHLQLAPGILRRLRPDLRIGFFLHIPFPPEELFAWLPWRSELLEGLLGADLVGFQTQAAAQNFARAARHYREARGSDARLEFEGRTVRVGAFPISIDFGWFDELARSPAARRRADEIRRQFGPERRLMLAVDRLDYTKGIDFRLRAFEELLRRGLATVEDCVFLQVAAPSREAVSDYAAMRSQIEQSVGRINGEFGQPGRVPVHYFRRSLRHEEIVSYYLAADVMVVTPLRDGMNLVAKEYVACKPDLSGVLVLSEFAGAAAQLKRALLVNPRHVDAMTTTFARALRLPAPDAHRRMGIMRREVRLHDVHEWAARFLGALSS